MEWGIKSLFKDFYLYDSSNAAFKLNIFKEILQTLHKESHFIKCRIFFLN